MELVRDRESGEDDRMVTCEIEAAEALAGLARGGDCWASARSSSGCVVSKDHATAVQKRCRNTSTTVPRGLVTAETISRSPSQLRAKIQTRKVRQILTEAEKEARRIHRVLANRESARQTIRQRQEMHLELTRKVAHLSEENKNLKKEKELAVKKYDSLKGSNEFLKLQIADKSNVVSKGRQMPNTLGEELGSSAAKRTPTILHNQPLVPFLLPSVVPCPNVQFPYVPHPEVISSSQLPIEHKDLTPSHQGQEMSFGNIGLGNTLFILPVPWLLPLLTHSNALNSKSDTRETEDTSSHQGSTSSPLNVLLVKGNHHPPSNLIMMMERPQGHEINHLNGTTSAPDHMLHSSVKKKQGTLICRQRKLDKTSASLQARRRRRELMRMKSRL